MHVKVWRVEVGGGTDLPLRADCVHCGTSLPSADTRPVIVWVKGEHGVDGVCNACRVRYDRETLSQMGRKLHIPRSPLWRRFTRTTT